MKKILSICALAIGAISLTSCEDFLDQTSPSEMSHENTFNNEYFTSIAVNKAYGDLTQDRTYSQDLAIIYNLNTDVELIDGLGSSNSTSARDRGTMNYNATPTSFSNMAGTWTAMYQTIEDCNLIIDGVEKSTNADNATMKQYLGEARAIRAMVYFDLLRIFGDIPMKLEPTKPDLSNAYIGKTDRDVIMDSLMVDLEKAVNELPWAGEKGLTTEHANKGYAHALLAQIALTKAGWAIRESAKSGYETATESDPTYPTQRPDAATRKSLNELALKHLSAVITSGKHNLNPSFKDEWYKINQLVLDKQYQENVFEIPMLQNVSGELGYTVGYRLNGVTNEYGYSNSSGKVKLTANLFYSYKEGDSRRDITVASSQITADKKTAAAKEAMLGNKPFELYVGKWDPRMENETWLAQNKAASAKHLTGINPVKIRYSQILLWYAEVMNELAGADGRYNGDAGITARQALALVHNRAFENKSEAENYINGIAANKNAFFNAIVDENAWELAGEGARKWDLIRWNLLASKTKQMQLDYLNNLENGTFQKKVYFNYANDAKTQIDMSSVTWNGLSDGKTEDDYQGSTDSYGKENDTQKGDYLSNISNGLIGVFNPTTKQWAAPASGVINRYIMPIPSTIISDYNGVLHNSYGFGD